MDGHFAVGWFIVKQNRQNRQNAILLIDVADDEWEQNGGTRYRWWCYIGIAVGADRNLEDKEFLQDDLIEDYELELMFLMLPALRPLVSRLLPVLSFWRGAMILRKPCWKLVSEVASRARSYTVATFWEPQYERLLWLVDSDKPSMKMPLSTYSSYTLSHRSTLFHNVSAYSVGDIFDGWVYPIISASVSKITFWIVYVLRR